MSKDEAKDFYPTEDEQDFIIATKKRLKTHRFYSVVAFEMIARARKDKCTLSSLYTEITAQPLDEHYVAMTNTYRFLRRFSTKFGLQK